MPAYDARRPLSLTGIPFADAVGDAHVPQQRVVPQTLEPVCRDARKAVQAQGHHAAASQSNQPIQGSVIDGQRTTTTKLKARPQFSIRCTCSPRLTHGHRPTARHHVGERQPAAITRTAAPAQATAQATAQAPHVPPMLKLLMCTVAPCVTAMLQVLRYHKIINAFDFNTGGAEEPTKLANARHRALLAQHTHKKNLARARRLQSYGRGRRPAPSAWSARLAEIVNFL